MKTNEHQFIVTVKTTKSKAAAKTALLCSFGCRQPDGCEFSTVEYGPAVRRIVNSALIKQKDHVTRVYNRGWIDEANAQGVVRPSKQDVATSD